MNADGFANLMSCPSHSISSRPPTSRRTARISRLEEASAGLIALTGGAQGPIDSAIRDGQHEQAAERLKTLQKIFGDRLYVELQRHGQPAEAEVEPELLALAYSRHLPIVATNECYFATRAITRRMTSCCASPRALRRRGQSPPLEPGVLLKSEDEMAALFADLPEALANTIEIAVRCAFRPEGRKPILPRFVAGETA